MGEGPEAGPLGEPTWAGAINRDSGNRQRSKEDAQPGHVQFSFERRNMRGSMRMSLSSPSRGRHRTSEFRAMDAGVHAPAPANFGGEQAALGSFSALAVWQFESL